MRIKKMMLPMNEQPFAKALNFAAPAQIAKIPNTKIKRAQMYIQSTYLVYTSLAVVSLAYSAAYRTLALRLSFTQLSDQPMVYRV